MMSLEGIVTEVELNALLNSKEIHSLSDRTHETGFLEHFSLADDRTTSLQQLVPGSEDYYYFHCLHYQHLQQYDQVDEMLKTWIERHGSTKGVREIRHRQTLLTYSSFRRRSLAYLQSQFRLNFDHQREFVEPEDELPTSLDPTLISRDRLLHEAISNDPALSTLEPTAFSWLALRDLDAPLRRAFLQRLPWPDVPQLPEIVLKDLENKKSGKFGRLTIHRKLLLSQLDECAQKKPELLDESAFVDIYLTKLRPHDDLDWRHHPDEEIQYFERLWNFVSRLSSTHASLKAHVLYHRLTCDQKRGVYDKQRFMTYLRIPRPMPYMRPAYLNRPEHLALSVNLQNDYLFATRLRPVVSDETLVRDFLQHFLVDAANTREFSEFIEDSYLDELFAESQLMAGRGSVEQWTSLLPADTLERLTSRIDLDFADTNPTRFRADSDVRLDLFIKNVPTLIVRVYRINAANVYRATQQPISTAINLDGLVPNEETIYQYSDPPVRRVRRTFEFPTLKEPGVYVIDFIGNGRSSRVLIHKGQLHYVMRVGAAGQMLTVLDEDDRPLHDASIWIGGRVLLAQPNGEVLIPFATKRGSQPILLQHGSLTTLDSLDRCVEEYELRAKIFCDRESLLSRNIAPLLISPKLSIQGVTISIEVLENPRVDVVFSDLDDVATSFAITDVQLTDDKEFSYPLTIPPRLRSLKVTISGKVRSISENRDLDVASSETFEINQIRTTNQFAQTFLTHNGKGYVLEHVGLTGEPLPGRAISLSLKHRDFKRVVKVSLVTDELGKVYLGELTDIDSIITDQSPDGLLLDAARDTIPEQIHTIVGETIQVPFHQEGLEAKGLSRADVALFELRACNTVKDRFDAIQLHQGALVIQGLEAGDYQLHLKRKGYPIALQVARGKKTAGYAVSDKRKLQLSCTSPLTIDRLDLQEDAVSIQLRNAGKNARVHVYAMHFVPDRVPFDGIAHAMQNPCSIHRDSPPPSSYVQGRKLCDEYRYILERKGARKFPGNMLPRPELLLNPREVRDTNTLQEVLEGGNSFESDVPLRALVCDLNRPQCIAKSFHSFPSLDFLPAGSFVALNLKPDATGAISIDRKQFAGQRFLYVVAVDSQHTTQRSLVMPASQGPPLDLRLSNGLDATSHFALQRQITVHDETTPFDIPDNGASRFHLYDGLESIFGLYETLLPDSKMSELRFLTRWNTLSDEEKAEQYAKHAGHELHYFLSRKDRPFFDRFVRPYLENKLHKTFMDHYLLGADLQSYNTFQHYSKLNVFEKILLSRRLEGEQERVARDMTQDLEFTEIDPKLRNRLFDSALLGYAPAQQTTTHIRSTTGVTLGQLDFSNRREDDDQNKRPEDDEANINEERHVAEDEVTSPDSPASDDLRADLSLRQTANDRRLFQPQTCTKEWAESNYFPVVSDNPLAPLLGLNPFWVDWANHPNEDLPFRSPHFAFAAENVTSAVLALAILDLPFASPAHQQTSQKQSIRVEPAGPSIVVSERIQKVEINDKSTSKILINQNFFRCDRVTEKVAKRRVHKFITGEFRTHVAYGGHVVVTNLTSSSQKLDILIQIPTGALPLQKTQPTSAKCIQLKAYGTETLEYFFYFPEVGHFSHYPVHITQGTELVAHLDPRPAEVASRSTPIDFQSWKYLSQYGEDADVIRYLEVQNLNEIELEDIAFRMSDVEMFRNTLETLRKRHIYHETLWSYSIQHNDTQAISEFLSEKDKFVVTLGHYIESPLLTIDPVARRNYEHLEYHPLINSRAHQVGDRRQIQNDVLRAHYYRWLRVLSYYPTLSDEQHLQSVYYLLLQDRLEEAIARFERIDPSRLDTRLQYDYCQAYLSMSQGKTDDARAIALRYQNHPVNRWREMFTLILNHLEEMDGQSVLPVNLSDRNASQDHLAAKQPTLDLSVTDKTICVRYRHLTSIQVRYYLMDIELLFSRNPFVQQQGQFSYIAPNATQSLDLPSDRTMFEWHIPEELQNQNVLVEVEGEGLQQSRPFYSNELTIYTMDQYGQLLVTDTRSSKPLSTIYCKVYARSKSGKISFYKDGYTDLRGRFDYASLTPNSLEKIDRFAILILSENQGAEVREVAPPGF